MWASGVIRLLKPAAVACTGIRRRVHGERVLDGIDLQVPVGARLLLVAVPDQAGTLLLRILAGLARADGGELRLAGTGSPDRSAAGWGRRVAYVGPDAGVYPWMSAAELLELSGDLLDLERSERTRRVRAAVARWGLATGLDRPMRRLGLGYMQRAAMAAALLGDPEVVLLDEPLRALDPDERVHLLRLPGPRRTIVLASRYPASEAGSVNQVALLRDGRVALHAAVSALDELGLPMTQRGIAALADRAHPLAAAES
jgi:ABC-2 type transport system ATP-binding protein